MRDPDTEEEDEEEEERRRSRQSDVVAQVDDRYLQDLPCTLLTPVQRKVHETYSTSCSRDR
ncbi:hypothetical protein EYF80_030630 [Liparis tanakae]|uniref:Uncharacterized protein n=1 Tax=Liparis tanakae TaxID=230148 RepID=A0A4Z2H147_9TELE|nr:hypothetical protein EYF80_030630 [Liparis tanakae]